MVSLREDLGNLRRFPSIELVLEESVRYIEVVGINSVRLICTSILGEVE